MTGATPERIGDFTIEGELGRGGSGVVYAARWHDRSVALKVLRTDEAATAKERERFLIEAQHLQRVTHRGVVRVLAAGELSDGRPYLAMERLAGTTLADRLVLGRLPVGVALDLFAQLTRAVGALHDAGIVHRDIKPENIMLVDGGQRLVLLDFGIARGVDDAESTTTQLGMQRGTPAYMAPERFFGARASIGSDVYETAVVLYLMLTGQLPWADARKPLDRLEPTPPSRRGVELAPGLERELMRALASTPESRPASIDELAAAIARCGWDGETERGASAPAPAPAPAAAATTRRVGRPALVGGLVAAVAAVSAVITLGVVGGGGADRAVAVAVVDGGATADGAVAAPDAGAAPTLVVVGAVDAGVVVVEAPGSGRSRPSGVRIRTGPAPARVAGPGPAAPGPAVGSGVGAAATATDLPSCARWVGLYCTRDFQETEGTLSGQQCAQMGKVLAQWRGLPVDARADQERDCATALPTVTAAINERLRQWRAGVGPGQRNAPLPPPSP